MRHTLALSVLVLTCVGCSPIGPDYERPDVELPQNWKSLPGANPALWKIANPSDDAPKEKWWKAFNDKTLEALIEKCLANNNTLQASLARLDQAIAQSEARGAALLPILNLGAAATRTRT